ncbi:MAG: glutamine synthetase family protein [SAR202 cluster bacterium]|jgi:glutamine synthetase|nr:glutamine synthetase family protein [SAR202 cluster bacterium]
MTIQEIVRKSSDAGVHLVTFLYCDNGGVIRGKSAHISSLAKRMESGIGLTVAMQAMSDMDDLQPIDGMGPRGEIRLIPDPNTFTILPYSPRRATMMADMLTLDRKPWAACPRDFLKKQIKRADDMGLKVQAAFEPEWSLARRNADGFSPIDDSLCFSGVGMIEPMMVIDDIIEALDAQGLQVEQYYPELGHGQQELTIGHADALRAADNHIVYRETVRNVARQHDLYASFAPKPFPDQAGNGCHLHISLWDATGEHNLFYDPDGRHNLSQMGYRFIGGILNHLRGLVAITAPSVNSYRRLSPNSWSSAFVCYGPDNREAAVRIPSGYWGDEMGSANLELKPSDSSANPYLALGSLISVGLDGIINDSVPSLDLEIDGDPATLPDGELQRRGIQSLPRSLDEAVLALEADEALMESLGPTLSEAYLAIRRADAKLFAGNDESFEVRHHFHKY